MVFYPSAELKSTPNDWGMDFENVALTTTDAVRLHGWYLPVKESKQALLFFHGNGGNISHRGESLEIFHSLGLDPEGHLPGPSGRPYPLVDFGNEPIKELFS